MTQRAVHMDPRYTGDRWHAVDELDNYGARKQILAHMSNRVMIIKDADELCVG